MIALLGAALAVAASPAALPVDSPVVAFVNVSVVPLDREGVLENWTVVVRDGRIVSAGPAAGVAVPAGALRVDGQGKYLMPGLAEMHGHLPTGAAAWTPELVERVLFLYVANGVTVVRGMQGHPAQLELRERIARGELLGPRLWVSSPALSGNSVPTIADARRLVEEYRAAGYDHLKIHEGLSREVYDTIVATARRMGIRFGGHVPNAVGLERALEAGQATIDHLDGFLEAAGGPDAIDRSAIPTLARRTREAGAWVVPTMALWETFNVGRSDELAGLPGLRYVPAMAVEWRTRLDDMRRQNPDVAQGMRVIAFRRAMLDALSDAGAGILMGTDSPQLFSVPGFSVHREMASMADAGLTPYQILRAGTVAVAQYFGLQDEMGRVAAGARADLILLEANPLADVANVARRAGVMVQGRWLPEAGIQAGLARLAAEGAGGETR